jgi:chromosome segregation ATPase
MEKAVKNQIEQSVRDSNAVLRAGRNDESDRIAKDLEEKLVARKNQLQDLKVQRDHLQSKFRHTVSDD